MIGVSKTFGGSSILSSPVKKKKKTARESARAVLDLWLIYSVYWIEEYPNPLQIASTGTAFEQSGQLSGA